MNDKLTGSGAYLDLESSEGMLLVDAYGDGGFRLQGRRVEGAVVVLENGFYPIEATSITSLAKNHVGDLWQTDEKPELLLVGTGERMALLPKDMRMHFEEHALPYELMDTGAAARTFNVLRLEGRKVAALLLPV